MALKATIFKANLQIADMDRHYYADHALTIARHPSETDERMMVRILAFAINAHEHLEFTKGLSEADEPDLWQKDLTGQIEHWIEVGQPDDRRLIKASNRADKATLYCYGGQGAQQWWKAIENKLTRLNNLTVIDLPQDATQALAKLAERSMNLSVTIQEGQIMVGSDKGVVEVVPVVLKAGK
ncbi:YaeQ family protein [Ampullimonas aquatilis]|uniref:YaeQ family protein n=1 Tax=Ampullimonas aquatilis TaxID=1341549 RepID=UPI003C722F8C